MEKIFPITGNGGEEISWEAEVSLILCVPWRSLEWFFSDSTAVCDELSDLKSCGYPSRPDLAYCYIF